MDKTYEDVINYFNEICKIPRGSKNEQAISNWIVELAKNNNMQVIVKLIVTIIVKLIKKRAQGHIMHILD